MVIEIETSTFLSIGIGVVGLMTGIISLFLMAQHEERIRPRLFRWIIKFVIASIFLFLIGILISITSLVLYIREIELILSIQLSAYFTLYLDLFGWFILSLGVSTLYRELGKTAELGYKLMETETKVGGEIISVIIDETPPFITNELNKYIKKISQRLEELGISSGGMRGREQKKIPTLLRQEIEEIIAKIEIIPEVYALEKLPSYFISVGNFYFEIGDRKKVMEEYNKAIELDPDFAMAYNNRGFVYAVLKQYDKAIEEYSKAIELDPDFAMAYFNRGFAYMEVKKYEDAKIDFKKELELYPQDINAMLNLSETYFLTKNYENANRAAENALNISEKSEEKIISYFSIICSLLFQKRINEASNSINSLLAHLKNVEQWELTWDFPDAIQAIKKSDLNEEIKDLALSLINLLENQIEINEFESKHKKISGNI